MTPRMRAALVCTVSLGSAAITWAGPPYTDQALTEESVQVSEHVWAIIGFPNVGIVVGQSATLVVDTGLGQTNGATVAQVAKKLAPHNRLYLTTTHFHPEHAAGVLGFPQGTLLFRNQLQQAEMDQHGEEMIQMFASRNELWNGWLTGEQLRAPDATFEREMRLNLGGGIMARLLWLGSGHTKGDELVFVDPDKTLISGDIVQNKVGPHIFGDGGTAASWIAAVDAASKLGAKHVLPDHSPIGDGSLVTQEQRFLEELRNRALASKQKGERADLAGKAITVEFKAKYPDWDIEDLTSFVQAAYAE